MAAPALPRRLLFLGFILLGAASGFFVGSLSHAMAAPANKGDAAQHNTLVVLVDDLQTEQPALEGIWLAARVGDEPQINWMPIYPLPLDEASPYSQAHSQIDLVSDKIEDLGSVAPIRDAGIWFDEVFMLDEAALNAIGNLAGVANSSLADPSVEPQGALQQQVELINSLCGSSWSDPNNLEQTLALIPNHLRSSLSPFDLIARWDSWSQTGFALGCTHPWAN